MSKNDLFLEIAETLTVSFVVLMFIYGILAFPEIVSGASMERTLYDGERILVEKISKITNNFERGDVIIFHPPGNDEIDYVKRIIGLPGDIVRVSDCSIFITRDGRRLLLEEPYLENGTCTEGGNAITEGKAQKIEEEQYLVLGDNRSRSADSRFFGLINKDRIIGKAIFRYWPISKLGFL